MFDSVDDGKRIEHFADESMFVAQPATDRLPKVYLLDAPSDPLGRLAHMAMMYQGKALHSLEEVSDADREYYIHDMEKNVLGVPSEGVMFYFLLENVSRSFTHQLVRTRIGAGYAQESLRFAVKEDFPVGLPPFLAGSDPDAWERNYNEYLEGRVKKEYIKSHQYPLELDGEAWEFANKHTSWQDKKRKEFEEHNQSTQELYLQWVNDGVPAEDARGMLPHWILTKVDMHISLTALMGMAGKRLCTQAQFEHRMVWNGIFDAIRSYGQKQVYRTLEPKRMTDYEGYSFATAHKFPNKVTDPANYGIMEVGDAAGDLAYERNSAWQFEVILSRFKPICYQTGRCQFRSDFDRYCNIRDRVEANYKIGRESSQWHREWLAPVAPKIDLKTDLGMPTYPAAAGPETEVGIPAIHPTEWLDPNAAIRPDGNWRSAEAKKNIEGRRL